MPAKMIDEAEYENKMKEILTGIGIIRHSIQKKVIPFREIKKAVKETSICFECFRDYLEGFIEHRLGCSFNYLNKSMKERVKFADGEWTNMEEFETELWKIQRIFSALSKNSRECDMYHEIIKPSVDYFTKLLHNEELNFSVREGLKRTHKVRVNPHEIQWRVVHGLLINPLYHGKENCNVICDYEGLIDDMHTVSITNEAKKLIPEEKLECIFEGVMLTHHKGERRKGLGLQNARSVMGKYGGRIWADSYVSPGPPEEPHFSSGLPLFKVTFGLPKYR